MTDLSYQDWKVRLAKESDIEQINKLAWSYTELVMPYIFGPRQVRAYMDSWIVSEGQDGQIGGFMHTIPSSDEKHYERNQAFLTHVKQVSPSVVEEFFNTPGIVFIAQIANPGKGSTKAIAEYLKSNYSQVWAWISVISPVHDFFEHMGIVWDKEHPHRYLNVWKGDWSTFHHGRWVRK